MDHIETIDEKYKAELGFSDEDLPSINERASEERRSQEREFFNEMEDNIIYSFSGTVSGEGDDGSNFFGSEKLIEIAENLSRDNSKSRSCKIN